MMGTRRVRVLFCSMLAVAAATGLVACGSGDDSGSGQETVEVQDATLVLDFIPGAIHSGVYLALERGYYRENDINLKVVEPSATADTLKLVAAGKAEFGISDGVDLGTQIAAGREVQGIMAITQRPSGGLITLAKEGITSPAQLQGKKVGITGVPSDRAVLDTIVEGAGGNPGKVDLITLGFNGVQALLANRVKAFTGFIPADGVQVESQGFKTRSFPLDEYGGPSYPGLVVFSGIEQIGTEPDLMEGFVEATIKGYREALADPDVAIAALADQTPELDSDFAAESFKAWQPLIGPAESFGQFKPENLEELSSYLVENGLADQEISPDRYANRSFTKPAE